MERESNNSDRLLTIYLNVVEAAAVASETSNEFSTVQIRRADIAALMSFRKWKVRSVFTHIAELFVDRLINDYISTAILESFCYSFKHNARVHFKSNNLLWFFPKIKNSFFSIFNSNVCDPFGWVNLIIKLNFDSAFVLINFNFFSYFFPHQNPIQNEWSQKFNDQFFGLGGFAISVIFIVRNFVEQVSGIIFVD